MIERTFFLRKGDIVQVDNRSQPEHRLREKIKRRLEREDLKLSPGQLSQLADLFVELFQKFVSAPEETKNEVYDVGEQAIFDFVALS